MRFLLLFVLLFANTIAYKWDQCSFHATCQIENFGDPPLVILSLDGFARNHLNRGHTKSLEAIAKCGVTTDRVIPSYPTKTFPNHYTMVTGLYPESHGIVDNNVMDIKISPKLVSMQKNTNPQYYTAEPIWSAYKRVTGKRAHCLFWPGCGLEGTAHPPDVSPKYNKSMTFEKRADMILDWLQMKPSERPGLITAYFHEPDSTGHKTDIRAEGILDDMLKEIDKSIDYFMTRLFDTGLSNCVNLVIVSDHGMKRITRKFYFDDILKNVTGSEKFVLASGAVGQIHLMDSGVDANKLADQLQCRNDDCIRNWKTYTRKTLPTRKHYSINNRVGDVILEGIHGSAFYKNEAEDKKKFPADHGYDFIDPEMHTIFFGRGPSFKQNVTVEPFQNIQYFNLWEALLGINGTVPNNGTVGFFDEILVAPPKRGEYNEYLTYPSPCSTELIKSWRNSPLTNKAKCIRVLWHLLMISKNEEKMCCFSQDCDYILVHNTTGDIRRTVVGAGITEANISNNTSFISLQEEHNAAYIDLPASFKKHVLEPLLAKHKEHFKHNLMFHAISGIATDTNHDGLADEIGNVATHFYRIVFYCPGKNDSDGTWMMCEDFENTRVVSYIFPIMDVPEDVQIIQPDFIDDYTATIIDVERIAGFQFHFPGYKNKNIPMRQRPFYYR